MRQYCISILGQHFFSLFADGHETVGDTGSLGLTGGKDGGYVAVLGQLRAGIEITVRDKTGDDSFIETQIYPAGVAKG